MTLAELKERVDGIVEYLNAKFTVFNSDLERVETQTKQLDKRISELSALVQSVLDEMESHR